MNRPTNSEKTAATRFVLSKIFRESLFLHGLLILCLIFVCVGIVRPPASERHGDDPGEKFAILRESGHELLQAAKPKDAVSEFEAALWIATKKLGRNDVRFSQALLDMGNASLLAGKLAQAESYLLNARHSLAKTNASPALTYQSIVCLSNLYLAKGDVEQLSKLQLDAHHLLSNKPALESFDEAVDTQFNLLMCNKQVEMANNLRNTWQWTLDSKQESK